MLTPEIKQYIDKSVLCWLATSGNDYMPNVSPKEMFTYLDDNTFLIAHLASPNSIANILENPLVCVSFVDIFIQKGFKIKGTASLSFKKDPDFNVFLKPITDRFGDKFPVKAVICINVEKVQRISAPSYFLFPETTTEESQIASAMKTYRVRPV